MNDKTHDAITVFFTFFIVIAIFIGWVILLPIKGCSYIWDYLDLSLIKTIDYMGSHS